MQTFRSVSWLINLVLQLKGYQAVHVYLLLGNFLSLELYQSRICIKIKPEFKASKLHARHIPPKHDRSKLLSCVQKKCQIFNTIFVSTKSSFKIFYFKVIKLYSGLTEYEIPHFQHGIRFNEEQFWNLFRLRVWFSSFH